MRISRLEARVIDVPMAMRFSHAKATRAHSENVLVIAEDDHGRRGHGESAPRSYVTGETPQSTLSALKGADWWWLQEELATREDIVQRFRFMNFPRSAGDDRNISANCARCAAELSILDLFGQNVSASLFNIFSNTASPPPQTVRYSGVVSSGTKRKVFSSLLKMRLFGFRDIKLKVGEDDETDLWIVKTARKIFYSKRFSLRVDVNGAWTPSRALKMLQAFADYGVASCEQPFPHGAWADFSWLCRASSIPIMLDESLCSREDAERAIAEKACHLFNLRLSKCGGLQQTLELADIARRNGLRFQIGCQVGETAILSAAGRHLAFLAKDARFLEGSYDRFLLAQNVTDTPISFGYGGKAGQLTGPGLGIDVVPSHVDALTVAGPLTLFDVNR